MRLIEKGVRPPGAAAVLASVFLALLFLAFQFFGDGLRDALDPRSR